MRHGKRNKTVVPLLALMKTGHGTFSDGAGTDVDVDVHAAGCKGCLALHSQVLLVASRVREVRHRLLVNPRCVLLADIFGNKEPNSATVQRRGHKTSERDQQGAASSHTVVKQKHSKLQRKKKTRARRRAEWRWTPQALADQEVAVSGVRWTRRSKARSKCGKRTSFTGPSYTNSPEWACAP